MSTRGSGVCYESIMGLVKNDYPKRLMSVKVAKCIM